MVERTVSLYVRDDGVLCCAMVSLMSSHPTSLLLSRYSRSRIDPSSNLPALPTTTACSTQPVLHSSFLCNFSVIL